MNFFIFGSRRSGKTTKAVEIIHTLNLPVVVVGLFIRRERFKREYPELQVYDSNKGLGPHIRLYEDFRTESMYPLEFALQAHTIVTCTPDNHKDDVETEPYKLYQWCIKKKWAIINLGGMDSLPHVEPSLINHMVDNIGKKHCQGDIYGKWYEPELENLKAQLEKYSNHL